MLDIKRPDLVAGVAGSGTMGRGIVQVLAQCGVRTLVFDAKPGAAQVAKDAIAKSLATLVQKGRVQQADAGRHCGAHRDRGRARRAQALPRGGRGDRRAAGAQAGTVQGA
jgi:3-hydroxyacyl-CoA dehydrogenase